MCVTSIKLEAFGNFPAEMNQKCWVVRQFKGRWTSLTECDAVHHGSLRVGQIPVHLFDDLLLHLGDAVTVQDFDRSHVGTFTVNQHLQGLESSNRL